MRKGVLGVSSMDNGQVQPIYWYNASAVLDVFGSWLSFVHPSLIGGKA